MAEVDFNDKDPTVSKGDLERSATSVCDPDLRSNKSVALIQNTWRLRVLGYHGDAQDLSHDWASRRLEVVTRTGHRFGTFCNTRIWQVEYSIKYCKHGLGDIFPDISILPLVINVGFTTEI